MNKSLQLANCRPFSALSNLLTCYCGFDTMKLSHQFYCRGKRGWISVPFLWLYPIRYSWLGVWFQYYLR